MLRSRLFLLLAPVLLVGCGLITPSKTSEEDQELQEFAERRQEAATYYDGGEFIRAAAQYKKALELRPEHFMTQLGYAYSLTNTRFAPNIVLAIDFLNKTITVQTDDSKEAKRVYGLAEAYRLLAMYHRRRAEERENRGLLDEAEEDRVEGIKFAQSGVEAYERILVIDRRLESRNISGPIRASASLAPLAHIGIAVCCIILGDKDNQGPLDRAVHEVNQYATIAARAREFWETRRERMMQIDPLQSAVDGPGKQLASVEERARYDEMIQNTVEKEAIVRQGLVETYMYLGRFEDGVRESSKILELDNSRDDALFFRARCYALMEPPNYERALVDMREYRSRQDLTRLTQKVIRINQLISTYETRLREQKREKELSEAAGG
ncbi:MAG: hypothetical protein AAGD14_11580 [Planctomycetota bacterium]